MVRTQEIFKHQGKQLIAALVGILFLFFLLRLPDVSDGSYLGLSTSSWYWLAVAVPIIHQFFVAFAWRIELHFQGLNRLFGSITIPLYLFLFFLLFLARFVTLSFLAFSNRQSLDLSMIYLYVIAVSMFPFVAYTGFSVVHYFGIRRAAGLDHFEQSYREMPMENRGIYKYLDNPMYIIAMAATYYPGLLLGSSAALLVALFNHLFIWVHYYCTEKPDMELIYGG